MDEQPEKLSTPDELIAKWRNVQRLLEELANEDADAVHMHNTARFDVFYHGIAWARSMADYHENEKNYTPEQRAMLRQASDQQRAKHLDAQLPFVTGDRVVHRYSRPSSKGTVLDCKSGGPNLWLLHIQWDNGVVTPMLDSNYVWPELPEPTGHEYPLSTPTIGNYSRRITEPG